MRLRQSWLARVGILAAVVAVTVSVAACGGGGEDEAAPETTAATTAAEETAPAETAPAETAETAPAETEAASEEVTAENFQQFCGLGDGEAATGEPILVGAVHTNGSGVDFSSAVDAAAAYFECVNANGGINGRPIEYRVENDELLPDKAGQLAPKLADEGVVAFIANTSFVDCSVNAQYYEQNGFNVIYGVGIPQSCFVSPAIAATNLGPRYSATSAAQYLVEDLGVTKLVLVVPTIPDVGTYTEAGVKAYAEQVGVEFESFLHDTPLQDPQTVAIQAVEAAGPDGGVLVVVPLPDSIAVMNAAVNAGVADQVKAWACSTQCNDKSLPGALDDYYNGKFWTDSELNTTDSTGPDNQLWLNVMDTFGSPDDPRDTFSQAGFLAAKIFVDTIMELPEDQLTKEGVNEAIAGITNYQTDLECKPWYFGPGPYHVPNNVDRVVALSADGELVLESDCREIVAADEVLPEVRAQEQELGLNSG